MALRFLQEHRQQVFEKARDPKTTFEELEHIARHDEDSESRAILALNTRLPEILKILSRDPVWSVREEVILNLNTPLEIVESLKEDESPDVSFQAKHRLAGGSERLEQEAWKEFIGAIRGYS